MKKLLVAAFFLALTTACGADGYVSSIVVEGYEGGRSVAELWNPGPGAILVDSVTITHSGTSDAASGFDLRPMTFATGGTHTKPAYNKNISQPDGVATLRASNPDPTSMNNEYSSKVLYEFWTGPKWNDRTYKFDPPFEVPPNYGLAVMSAEENVYMPVTFEYRDKEQ